MLNFTGFAQGFFFFTGFAKLKMAFPDVKILSCESLRFFSGCNKDQNNI